MYFINGVKNEFIEDDYTMLRYLLGHSLKEYWVIDRYDVSELDEDGYFDLLSADGVDVVEDVLENYPDLRIT